MKHLLTILHLRLAIMGLILSLSVVSQLLWHVDIPWIPLLIVWVGMGIFTGISYGVFVPRFDSESLFRQRLMLFFQLVFDALALTVIFGLTGGASNPFTGLYLIGIIVSAMVLPSVFSWILLGVSVSGYVLISNIQLPLTISTVMGASTGDHLHHHGSAMSMDFHLIGMIISFATGAVIVAVFITRLARNIRDQSQRIRELQSLMSAEHYFARMGILAAGYAHEMNTPLSTLMVLHESLSQHESALAIESELAMMDRQLNRLDQTVRRIQTSLGAGRAETSARQMLGAAIAGIVQDWSAFNAHIPVTFSHTSLPDFYLQDTIQKELHSIIQNILDNAAGVATALEISYEVVSESDDLLLTCRDNGPGISEAVLAQLHHPLDVQLSRHEDHPTHRGLGLILTQFLVRRLRGEMTVSRLDPTGTQVQVRLPLRELQRHD